MAIRWASCEISKNKDLSSELQSSPLVQRARDVLKNSGKTVIQVISDYLELLWNYAEQVLTKTLGGAAITGLPFHFVVATLAIWKPYAWDAMGQVVRNTSMIRPRTPGPTHVTFAPEPGAAGLSTLLEYKDIVQKGNAYIVCDAGGGSVVR